MTLHHRRHAIATIVLLTAAATIAPSSWFCAAFAPTVSHHRPLSRMPLGIQKAPACHSPLTIVYTGSEDYNTMSGDEDSSRRDRGEKSKQWVKPVVAAPLVLAAFLRLTSGYNIVTRTTFTIAVMAPFLWRCRRRRISIEEAEQEYNVKVELHKEQVGKGKIWANKRLSEAQVRDQAEEDARRAAEMASARKWAASTLESTTQLQQEVEERRTREALDRARAANWLESTSNLAGIELHGGGIGGADSGMEDGSGDHPDRAVMWLKSTSKAAGIDLTGGRKAEDITTMDSSVEDDQY